MSDLQLEATRQAVTALGQLLNGCIFELSKMQPVEADKLMAAALAGIPHRTQLQKLLRRTTAGRRAFRLTLEREAA